MKSLADELREENELMRRRFVHATRPKHPLNLQEAMELCQRMETSIDRATATIAKPAPAIDLEPGGINFVVTDLAAGSE